MGVRVGRTRVSCRPSPSVVSAAVIPFLPLQLHLASLRLSRMSMFCQCARGVSGHCSNAVEPRDRLHGLGSVCVRRPLARCLWLGVKCELFLCLLKVVCV